MNLYFTYQSRDAFKSLALFITVKARLDFCRSLVSGLPSSRRTAGRVSSKACLWRKIIIKILAALLVVRNVIWCQSLAGPHYCLRLVTFVHVPFSPPPLLILAFQTILFHTIVTDGHYMLFSIEQVFKKNWAELFDCGVSNDMSKVKHQLVCIVLTQCFCFASSGCFGSFKNLILCGFVRDWCCFPSKRLLYTSICLSIFVFLRSMFAFMRFILLFVDFVRYLTFRHDMIQIYRCSRKNVRWLFRVFYKPLWNRSGIISSVEGIWLDVPLTRSLFISHNFYATTRKIIYAACSIQAGRYFIGRN